jgi:hypothetical protein
LTSFFRSLSRVFGDSTMSSEDGLYDDEENT